MSIKDLLITDTTSAEDRKKPSKPLIAAILLALIILIAGSLFDRDDTERIEVEKSHLTEISDFSETEGRHLESILKKINGAGNVSVYISVESGGEKILARDIKSDTSKEELGKNDNGLSESAESESNVVMSGKDEVPYIVEETAPQISGVLVVAEGASSEKVRLEIYDAVKALYGISAHRIKIAY